MRLACSMVVVVVVVLSPQVAAQPSAEVTAAPPAPPPAGYDHGFFLRSADATYELRFTGRLQTYFLGTSTAAAGDRTESGLFELHRARLGLEGKLGRCVLFKTQTELGKGNAHLKDFRIDVALGGGVWLRAGQWKRPFSRQFITSSFRLELVERAITDKAFATSRDVGIALRNDYEKSVPIEWTIGIYDGLVDEKPTVIGDVVVDPMTGEGELTGTITNMPAAFRPMIVGRIGLNHGAVDGYSEGDLEGGPLRWGVATSVQLEGDVDRDGRASHKAEADFVIKAAGVSASGAVYLATTGTGFTDATELSLFGAHAQVGYLANGRIGVSGRYAVIAGLGDNTTPDQHEVAAGVSYYLRGRDDRVQIDLAGRKLGPAGIADNLRLEVQGQVSF